MLGPFPWWSDEQKKFSAEMREFVNQIMPRSDEAKWKREFPWDIFEYVGSKGYVGAMIPKEYGGLGLGMTGACIAAEEMCRMPNVGRVFIGNLLGGAGQILAFGTKEQKERFLPRISKGELGAICITEPFAGTDAAAIETVASRDNNTYVISGKKRFIVSAGVADRYMLYARTSNDPETVHRHKHLTGFILEKGMPGFSTEKINEIIGFHEIQNGSLDLDEVKVPLANRIGDEGEGWSVMMEGVNVERTLLSAQVLGWLRTLIETVIPYTQRRVQFGRRTADMLNNQLKISDLFIKLKMSRLACFYTAYLYDNGQDVAMEAATAKAFNCQGGADAARDTIQIMGGDGLTPFYMPETIYQVAKVEEISGGTLEAMRLIIHRAGMRQLAKEFSTRRRITHKDLGVPITTYEKAKKLLLKNEDTLLTALAEDYKVNPGLHMSRADLTDVFDIETTDLDKLLESLEKKGLVKLYRSAGKIEMAKATYEGLKRAYPLEYYKWFPYWVGERGKF